jgi:hypothetical protein
VKSLSLFTFYDFPVFYLLQILNGFIIDYFVTGKLHKIVGNCLMMYLNKWNQREIYSEILIVHFHIMCQIMDYPLKLMEICLKTIGLFMTRDDKT